MQKQKSKSNALYVVLVVIAVVAAGVYQGATLLNKASAEGVRCTANFLPVSSWGWGSKNWKGQRSLDSDEALDSDVVCASGTHCAVAVLRHYLSTIMGPVAIVKQITEYQPWQLS